jgi:prevent-host-death family protein
MKSRAKKPRKRAGRVSEPVAASGGTMPAGVFKARCLELMDRVNERGGEIVITKYGKPVAKLVPVRAPMAGPPASAFGALKGSVLWYGDLISPVDDEWEVDRD